MFPQVPKESIAGPSPLNPHHVERDSPQKVLQGGSNANAMALQRIKLCFLCRLCYPFQELSFGQHSMFYLGTLLITICKKMMIIGGIIDLEVVC